MDIMKLFRLFFNHALNLRKQNNEFSYLLFYNLITLGMDHPNILNQLVHKEN